MPNEEWCMELEQVSMPWVVTRDMSKVHFIAHAKEQVAWCMHKRMRAFTTNYDCWRWCGKRRWNGATSVSNLSYGDAKECKGSNCEGIHWARQVNPSVDRSFPHIVRIAMAAAAGVWIARGSGGTAWS